MKQIFMCLVMALTSCSTENPVVFSEKALNDTFITQDSKEIRFEQIINQYKGKKVVIDVWASWCGDCIKGMPKLQQLQQDFPEVVYLLLSLDYTIDEWKFGIKKYQVQGAHYLMQSGWKGDFGSFLGLDWIPRYIVIDETGEIAVFKAVHADDERILGALKN